MYRLGRAPGPAVVVCPIDSGASTGRARSHAVASRRLASFHADPILVAARALVRSPRLRASPPPRAPAAAGSFDLVVAATTDVHGRLRGWNYESNRPDPARGLARAATIVDSLRAAAPGRVVLIDAGDLLQGNSLTYVAARGRRAGRRTRSSRR